MKVSARHSVGWFPAWTLPLVAASISTVGILVSYFIAVDLGHVRPIPFTDITHAAIQYPEYIIFRATMIPGALLIGIVLSIVAWWIQLQADSAKVLSTGLQIMTYASWVAAFLLCVSTATISDGGDINWTLHSIGATGFFLIMVVVLLISYRNYINIFNANPSFITKISFYIKTFLAFTFIIEIVIYVITKTKPHVFPDWSGNALEWALVVSVISYIGTFSLDIGSVNGQLEEDQEEEQLTTVDDSSTLIYQPVATTNFIDPKNFSHYFEVTSNSSQN